MRRSLVSLDPSGPPPPVPTPIYHITHVRNLPAILASGGLACASALRQHGVAYADIAHEHIQDRRATTPVPCGPGGVLHDYVPFYFAPRSPMLYSNHRGNVPSNAEGQRPIVHLVTTAQRMQALGVSFAFTDGHGTMEITDFYDDLTALGQVDWAIMRARYWSDTDEDSDRRRRRQAEFLVRAHVPWTAIEVVGVIDEPTRAAVLQALAGVDYRPRVVVRRDWYY